MYNYNATTSTDFNNITDVQINPDNWKINGDTISFRNDDEYSDETNDSVVSIGNIPNVTNSIKYHVNKINDSLVALTSIYDHNSTTKIYSLSRHQNRIIK